MALELFYTELQQRPEVNMRRRWSQQSGATPHTVQPALNWISNHFGAPVISLMTRHIWSPKSPDLTPLDSFVWGRIKDRAYVDKPWIVEDLKEAIIR